MIDSSHGNRPVARLARTPARMPGSEDVRDDLTLEVYDGDGNKPSQQGSSGHGVERETEPPGGGGEQRRGEASTIGYRHGIGTEHARQRPRRARNERIGMSCHAMAAPRIPGRPSLDATDCAPRGRER